VADAIDNAARRIAIRRKTGVKADRIIAQSNARTMNTLHDKTLFITGASRGIGKAIALRAARDGARVVIAAKTAEPDPRLAGTLNLAAPGQAEQARKPEIMAEAAYWILTQDSRQVTGRSFLDEDVLREAGISDFSGYAMDPAITPDLDYFVEA